MNKMKYIFILMISTIITYTSFLGIWGEVFALAPSFEANYVEYLMGKKWENKAETLWDLSKIGINKNLSLKENLKNMFYPDLDWQGGRIWDIVKVIGLIVFVTMLVVQWLKYVINSDAESKVNEYHRNFVYIFLWGLIFFGATWILWVGLNIWWDWWSAELMNKLDQSLMFQIFSWLRALAFFVAIILLIYTGWKIMVSMEQEAKFKAASQWILNIIIPLLIIKIIDYIYFIAQSPNFKSQATTLIVEISKAIAYILWWFFTLMIIYYGFRLMFWGWSDEHLKKVKNIIVAVFLWSLVIFIFFLIIYQIAQEFTW